MSQIPVTHSDYTNGSNTVIKTKKMYTSSPVEEGESE